MTREDLDFIGSMNMCDEISNEAYKKIMCHCKEQEPCEDCISRKDIQDYIAKYLSQYLYNDVREAIEDIDAYIGDMPSVQPKTETEIIGRDTDGNWHDLSFISKQEPKPKWIPVSERLPETDNENSINNYNVLLWVKNKSHPEREPQIYLGKLNHVKGDDGSGNFWGIETSPCDWTIWGWCYFDEPEVIAWQPLPEPYKEG